MCLTGLWRNGTELDRCRDDFLRTCLDAVHPVFRVDSQYDMTNFTSTQQQALQLQLCDKMISRSPFATSIVRVLRIRPDTITHAIPLWQLPNLPNVVYTYAPFWHGLENERVQLNDVFMLFHRALFRRLVQGEPWAVVSQREAHRICNFSQRVSYMGTFECALHVQARRKNLTIRWRRAGEHPSYVLHPHLFAGRLAPPRINTSATNASQHDAQLQRLRCGCRSITNQTIDRYIPA